MWSSIYLHVPEGVLRLENRSDTMHGHRRGATVSFPAGGLHRGLLTTFSCKLLAKGTYLLHPHIHRIQFYYHFSLKDKCLHFWITVVVAFEGILMYRKYQH